MLSDGGHSEHRVFCDKHIQKGERVHSIDMSKEWCKFIFEQKLLKLSVDQSCYMHIYRAYQKSLVDKKLTDARKKVDIAVQTDSVKLCDLSTTINTTTTTFYSNIDSSTKRHAFHSVSSNSVVSSPNNVVIDMPFSGVPSSKSRCYACNAYYTTTNVSCCFINAFMHSEALLTRSIIILEGSTCCHKHLNKNGLLPDGIASIKNMKSGRTTINRDDLLHAFDDLKITYKRLESIVSGAYRRPAIDFNDSDRFTDKQYFILMGITKENYKNLCASISPTSFRKTELHSANQSIGWLLVKLHLGLSNSVLATLFSFRDERTVSRVLESTRLSPMDHFVPKHLSFEHISRRDVIDQHTPPLAKGLFTNPGNNKTILILAGTYIYIQKSANSILQPQTFSMRKGRPLIKPTMIV